MRVLLLICVCALAGLATSSPIDHKRQLINRPSNDVIFRSKKSTQIKGHNVLYVKGRLPTRSPERPYNPELNLRKGEYMCGNKVCKLRPGEIPPGCENHICQYPIGGPDLSKQFAPVPQKPTQS